MSQYIITLTDEDGQGLRIDSVAVHSTEQIAAGKTTTTAVLLGQHLIEYTDRLVEQLRAKHEHRRSQLIH